MSVNKIYFIAQIQTNNVRDIRQEESSWLGQAQRVGVLALPFLSLYKPFGFSMALGLGAVRAAIHGSQLAQAMQAGETSSDPLLQTAISVASLAGTLLAHPLGMVLATLHDLVQESGQLIVHLQAREDVKALDSALSILSNALYLAAIGVGGMELSIASLAMQVFLGLYHGYREGQTGNVLEMAAHIAMAGIRGKQLHDQCKLFQMQQACEKMMVKRPKQETLSLVCLSGDPNVEREISMREWAVAQGHLPDYVDNEGNTFLHRLVKMNRYEDLKVVFQEKFCLEQLDTENKKHFRPIDLAIEKKDRVSLQIFTTHFQDRYIHYKNLFQAAHLGWKEGLDMLLSFYDQQSVVDPKESLRLQILKETAGMPAEVPLREGLIHKIPIEKYRENLLEQRYRDYQLTYPKKLLQEAVYSGDLDTVKFLVEYGCPVNELNYHLGRGVLGGRQMCYPVVSPLSLAEYFHPDNQELFDYLQQLGAVRHLNESRLVSDGWGRVLGNLLPMKRFFSSSLGPVSPEDYSKWKDFGKMF